MHRQYLISFVVGDLITIFQYAASHRYFNMDWEWKSSAPEAFLIQRSAPAVTYQMFLEAYKTEMSTVSALLHASLQLVLKN